MQTEEPEYHLLTNQTRETGPLKEIDIKQQEIGSKAEGKSIEKLDTQHTNKAKDGKKESDLKKQATNNKTVEKTQKTQETVIEEPKVKVKKQTILPVREVTNPLERKQLWNEMKEQRKMFKEED